MDIDDDLNILSKLGILQSTSSHKTYYPTSDFKYMSDINDYDVSSDDCIFENTKISITNSQVIHKQNNETSTIFKTSIENFTLIFYFFCLICVLNIWKDFMLYSVLNITDFTERSFTLFKFFNTYGISCFFGLIIAGFIYKHFNLMFVFFIFFLTLIILFFAFFTLKLVSANFSVLIVGFVSGVCFRGVLLLPFLVKKSQRFIFYICLALSLSSVISSFIIGLSIQINDLRMNQNSTLEISQPKNMFKRAIFLNNLTINNTLTTIVPVNASLNLKTFNKKKPKFKSKTEENQLMRQEAELRQKQKQKLQEEQKMIQGLAVLPQTTTLNYNSTFGNNILKIYNKTTTDASVKNKEFFVSITIITTSTITSNLRKINLEKHEKDLRAKNLTIAHIKKNDLIFKFNMIPVLFIMFSGLFIHSIIIICFGCFSKEKTLKINLFEELNNGLQTFINSESFLCQILSFIIWLFHFILENVIFGEIILCFYESKYYHRTFISSATFFGWSSLFYLIAIIWPKQCGSTKTIHIFYLFAIFLCFVFYYAFEKSSYFKNLSQLSLLGFFVCTLPWLIFSWLSDFIKPDITKLSLRFLISNAFGKILTGYLLNIFSQTRLITDNLKNVQSFEIHNFSLNLLCACYMFFIFLLYEAKRVNRKQQIFQLSEEVKGHCVINKKQEKVVKLRNKGKYTTLLNENHDDITENEFSSSDELDFK